MEKVCKKCGESKDLEMFYRDKRKSDGLFNACKACEQSEQRKRRRTETHKDAMRDKRQTAEGRARMSQASSLRRSRYPFKSKAKSKVNSAIRSGKVPRAATQPCLSASEDCYGAHNHHHDSYRESDWLNTRVLCRHHHIEWHRNNEAIPYVDPRTETQERPATSEPA
jgi:hypothetical protein